MLNCLYCGYSLTGVCTPENPVGPCPECGKPFNFEHLTSATQLDQTSLTVPLLSLLVPPILVGTILAGMLFVANSYQGSTAVDMAGLFAVGVLALVGIGLSVLTGRRLARRIAMRPVGSMPNLSSVSLTIVLAGLFCMAQFTLAFCIFFCGCTCMVLTA